MNVTSMEENMGVIIIITYVSIAFSVVSFLLYALEVCGAIGSKPAADAKAIAGNNGAKVAAALPNLDQIGTFLGAVSKLVDSLSKAGTSLTSLIGAFLFLAMATFVTIYPSPSASEKKPAAAADKPPVATPAN
jgi:hypothetical protein